MSVNRYTTASGLQTLANGQRIWVGDKASHTAAKQAGTLPTDCLICITDDDDEFKTDDVIEDSQMVITSGGVYDALPHELTTITKTTNISGDLKSKLDTAIAAGRMHYNYALRNDGYVLLMHLTAKVDMAGGDSQPYRFGNTEGAYIRTFTITKSGDNIFTQATWANPSAAVTDMWTTGTFTVKLFI